MSTYCRCHGARVDETAGGCSCHGPHKPTRGEVEAFFADEACGCGEPLSDASRADMALGYPGGVFVAPRPMQPPSSGSLRPDAPQDATGAPLTPTTAQSGT